jgi:hypothetical protein
VPVFFPGDDLSAELETFVSTVGCSSYWRTAVAEYGIGDAIAATAVHLTEAAPDAITDSQIEAWLAQQIVSNTLEPPTSNSIYVLFYPSGTTITQGGETSCDSFGGYHTNITLPDGTLVAYAAIPRCDSFQGLSTLAGTTGAASHEIIEASTDPYNKENPAYEGLDDAHSAYAFFFGGEDADLCAQEPDAFFQPADFPFTVQRNWSNRAAKTGSPCLPRSSDPFFTAVPRLTDDVDLFGTKTRGVVVPSGTSKQLDVELFSESPSAVISLHVVPLLPGGSSSVVSFDQNSGRSGDTVRLTIASPPDDFGTELFVIGAASAGRARYASVVGIGH